MKPPASTPNARTPIANVRGPAWPLPVDARVGVAVAESIATSVRTMRVTARAVAGARVRVGTEG